MELKNLFDKNNVFAFQLSSGLSNTIKNFPIHSPKRWSIIRSNQYAGKAVRNCFAAQHGFSSGRQEMALFIFPWS